MSKTCNDCRNYRQADEYYLMGRCVFPLPYWLMIGASGGGFVDDHIENNCMTFAPYEKNKGEVKDE